MARLSDESPDKKYVVYIYIYKEYPDSEDAFIHGILMPSDKNLDIEPRRIFWEKVKSTDIENVVVNNITMDYWVDVMWLDAEHIKINGKIVDINEGYDYRKK